MGGMTHLDDTAANAATDEKSAEEDNAPTTPRTDGKIFDDLKDFVAAPRFTSLVTRKADDERDARAIAAVTELNKKGDAYTTRLVELDPEGGPALTLTRSKKGEALVGIGERGELYFSSQRPDEDNDDDLDVALWMLPPRGEARVILRRPGGVNSVIAAGGKLYITAQTLTNATDEETNREILKERKDGAISAILHEDFPVRYWDHDLGPAYSRLYVADVPDFDGTEQIELSELPIPDGKLQGISVADDGSSLLLTINRPHAGTDSRSSVYHLVPGKDATPLAIAPALREDSDGEDSDDLLEFYAGDISPDGRRAVLSVTTGNRDGKPLREWAELVDLESGERRRLMPDFDDWPGSISWLDDEALIMQADRRGRVSLYLVDVSNGDADEVTLLTDGDESFSSAQVLDAATILALRSSISKPAVPVRIDVATGEVSELAAVIPVVEPVGQLTEVTATAEDGTEVRAWLALPEEIPSGGAPLLVFAHGGPWGSWNDWTWRWNPGPFVAKGYAVLLPDPAISTGYGQHMIDRGNDAIGDAPYTDILALIDATIARDDIDGEHTALLGGSYGGYMANWMAGHTGDRFRCIVTHASLWDIDIMGRTTDNGVWHEWMRESQSAAYSPHEHVANIEVPMLVIHGDKDYRVPISQGHALWHALLRDSKATGHKFLYYPDENHWILKPQNSRIWYETVLAFVDAHVRGKDFVRPRELG
ncbi:Dipeptidyl aminopeptidase/acylaminoacyl peptidase [Bowdeniella nasicola]|uniref:Dipeptidyl aminopeptidase/acylaminoacyl peptidase n=2 Tax=Bowdeniella nasicola TaxID=208480 RepID=A0A1H4D604_9ACTO|nr:Dipeptidyl aminopeptidase/acylaminoacyl peptidase [Bowdeniella nasicola]